MVNILLCLLVQHKRVLVASPKLTFSNTASHKGAIKREPLFCQGLPIILLSCTLV